MARVTIENALKKVKNKYELVLIASSRAYDLSCGHKCLVDTKNKYAVASLREIESDLLDMKVLYEGMQNRLDKNSNEYGFEVFVENQEQNEPKINIEELDTSMFVFEDAK